MRRHPREAAACTARSFARFVGLRLVERRELMDSRALDILVLPDREDSTFPDRDRGGRWARRSHRHDAAAEEDDVGGARASAQASWTAS